VSTIEPQVGLPSLEALYEHAACGLMLADAGGIVRRINHTMCAWLGLAAPDVVGKRRLQDLLTMGGQLFYQTHLAPLLLIQGSVSEVKLDVKHADGSTLPMVMNAAVRTHQGHRFLDLALFVAKDRNQYEIELLRARQRAEALLEHEKSATESLAKAQQQLDQQRALAEDRATVAELMIGIVSHDLRNPLGVIRMGAHLLSRGELSSTQIRALERIASATARAERMIADLLDLTQVRLGKGLKVKLAPLELHAVVGDVVEDLRLRFAGREIVHVRQGDGTCDGSVDRLAQVVGNLVANAISYGSPGRPVTVVSSTSAQGCEISVHNHGEPIDPELLPAVFEPMRRGDELTDGTQGVGLGLFIVQAVAHAHGGAAFATSTAEEGTRLAIRWPRAAT
jgi:sigma-B regulation protein RsbU (phosphoserine phosphatase)